MPVILTCDFYPRPPRGGRRICTVLSLIFVYFYPRPPRGGRPKFFLGQSQQAQDFYPRPPRGGRPISGTVANYSKTISIHALREEGDYSVSGPNPIKINFYPRPPRGGRQGYRGPKTEDEYISIHALREEGDQLPDP